MTDVPRLATHLYSTETRYVFELIQNAEDNAYSHVISRGEDPYIHFHIYPDRVVVDSNEDGFTEAHVRSICATGDSTKTNEVGYIGEKGIGFKSVFKIASRVHIQSGSFSFYFEHNPGDSGIGMVAPINTGHEQLPDSVRTRLTLILLDPSRFADRVNDTREVPDTFILFLSKLKRISFLVTGPEEDQQDTTYSCTYDSLTSSAKLAKVVNGVHHDHFYKIAKRTVSRLPTNEARRDRREAEVILAFLVDEHSAPITEPQYVFSFLPMRKVGFNVCQSSNA